MAHELRFAPAATDGSHLPDLWPESGATGTAAADMMRVSLRSSRTYMWGESSPYCFLTNFGCVPFKRSLTRVSVIARSPVQDKCHHEHKAGKAKKRILSMDFHKLSRDCLQALCMKNNIRSLQDYASDISAHLRSLELKLRPVPNYTETVQKEISAYSRNFLVKFLIGRVELQQILMDSEVICLAVSFKEFNDCNVMIIQAPKNIFLSMQLLPIHSSVYHKSFLPLLTSNVIPQQA